MTGLIDVHCHLYEPDYEPVMDALMVEMAQNGVEYVLCSGCELVTTKKSIAIAEKYPMAYAEAGFHPCDTADVTEEQWREMKQLIKHPRVVAVGEIGLDYYWDSAPRDVQKYWFEKQIDYAGEVGKPIVIHTRKATEDTLEILSRLKPPRAVLHCFSGSVETMRQVIAMGYSISLGGVVTFKNARHAVDCAREVPADRLMLETDCPFLAPEPFRGKLNRPDYVRFVAEKIAALRGVTPQEVADFTNANAKRFFNI